MKQTSEIERIFSFGTCEEKVEEFHAGLAS
jgi:hypothetical protein